MPTKSPSTPKVSTNPFEDDDEIVSPNPFENSEELDESNPFYEPSPSPKRSPNPFEVSGEFEQDSITPTTHKMLSPQPDNDGASQKQRNKSPGRFQKNVKSPSSPSGRKSPQFEKKKKSPLSGWTNKSPKRTREPSPPPPTEKARSARGSAPLTKEQDRASKNAAKAVLSPG